MKEIWKHIKGYEGLYQVSNCGNIKSLGNNKTRKEKLLKYKYNHSKGHKQICLYKNGKYKWFFIHRLVAEAFIPNTHNLPCVNHKDEDRGNNRVDNLEWCTQKYNINYGNAKNKISIGKGKIVNQYDLNGNFVNSYYSTRNAGKCCNIRHQSISECCRGEREKAGGFIWKYA